MTLILYQVIRSGIAYSQYGNMEADGTYINLLKIFLKKEDAQHFAESKDIYDTGVYKITIKDNIIEALYREMISRREIT